MKVIIVGATAGGIACAIRLRRLDENAEIIIIKHDRYVSNDNCGFPVHIGGIFERETALLIDKAQTFKELYNIDVRTRYEVADINVVGKTITLNDLETGKLTTQDYDKLVLATCGVSDHSLLPGIDLPGIFHVRTVTDAKAINDWIGKGGEELSGAKGHSDTQTQSANPVAVVIGGACLALEISAYLAQKNYKVTLVESGDQVLPLIDQEYAREVESLLQKKGIEVMLNDTISTFECGENHLTEVITQSGRSLTAHVVILASGVRPDHTLANMAGLKIGGYGGIRVDEQMRTGNPDIFAVGDSVEVKDYVANDWGLFSLALPSINQGRIVADVICGRDRRYRGTQGTSIVSLFDAAAAWTGINEEKLLQMGEPAYEKIYVYPNGQKEEDDHAVPMTLKIIFRKSDGLVLGAQALGTGDVNRTISVLAGMIQMCATVYDLEEAELGSTTQSGRVKDAVNLAGIAGAGVLRGDMPISHWEESLEWL